MAGAGRRVLSHARRRRVRASLRSRATGTIAVVLLGLSIGAGAARPASRDAITISMLAYFTEQPGYEILIPNFERVYPNITVDVTYAANPVQEYQLETTELAAGDAPDILATIPGCGTPISVCTLARDGDLAPLVDEPWARRSVPLVTSLGKYGQGLFAFPPEVAPFGIWTNDDRFKQLGLKIPQTFAQLLAVCERAKAAGQAAIVLPGASATSVSRLIADLAVANVYGKDQRWAGELRAGKVTFDGTAGWHQALQQFVDMDNADCFQQGAEGTAGPAADLAFAQGQGLMKPALTSVKGTIDSGNPQFGFSHHPFPGGSKPGQTETLLNLSDALGVNAQSSQQAQAAARTFIDFMARPKQDALFAETEGGLTPYEFLKNQIPGYMSDFATVFKQRAYVVNPVETWWNANVLLALQQNQIGLITGQRSIDDVLNAMDAAWKQGPS
jgi:raffinose/stachyose/melibiose transport system substrate-binding protein